jgi:hypothetical protein
MPAKGGRGAQPFWTRPPLFRGTAIAQILRGQIHFQKWPKKRGRPKSPVTREHNAKFKEANYAVKFVDSQARWWAERVAKGGPVYPRDLLLSLMYGRLFETLIIDGQEWNSVAVRNDISHDLDIVAGKEIGTLLARGSAGWQALVPTEENLVLTSNGPDALPSYRAAGGGGSQVSFFGTSEWGGYSTHASASKGVYFDPAMSLSMVAAFIAMKEFANAEYIVQLWSMDGTTLVEKIAESLPWTATATGERGVYVPFISPAFIDPGNFYYLCQNRTDATDTTPCGANGYGSDIKGFPWAVRPPKTVLFKKDPQPDDVVNLYQTYQCWLVLPVAVL